MAEKQKKVAVTKAKQWRKEHPEFFTEDGLDTRFKDDLIIQIREAWRFRVGMIKANTALVVRAKAMLRRLYHDDDPNKSKKAADEMWRRLTTKREQKPNPHVDEARLLCLPLLQAREPILEAKRDVERTLEKLVTDVPIYEKCQGIAGLGKLSLAGIVGECGDLSVYPDPAKVWKRFGVAVIDGGRQRRVQGAEEAEKHGYDPSRRSVLWNVAAAVFKVQSGEHPGYFRRLYDQRKAYELEKVETAGHAHNRALRYMSKRLLVHLWREWRIAKGLPVEMEQECSDDTDGEKENQRQEPLSMDTSAEDTSNDTALG